MDYTISNLKEATNVIPPKARRTQKSPLFKRMENMPIGDAFVLEGAEMASVAPNAYATAKRAGIKVTLRQIPEGVGVWRIRNPNPQTDLEVDKENEGVRGRGKAKKAA